MQLQRVIGSPVKNRDYRTTIRRMPALIAVEQCFGWS